MCLCGGGDYNCSLLSTIAGPFFMRSCLDYLVVLLRCFTAVLHFSFLQRSICAVQMLPGYAQCGVVRPEHEEICFAVKVITL